MVVKAFNKEEDVPSAEFEETNDILFRFCMEITVPFRNDACRSCSLSETLDM